MYDMHFCMHTMDAIVTLEVVSIEQYLVRFVSCQSFAILVRKEFVCGSGIGSVGTGGGGGRLGATDAIGGSRGWQVVGLSKQSFA